MRASTLSRHLGAAKVLELLLAVDRTRARIISNHQIGGTTPVAAPSAGRGCLPNSMPGRHTLSKTSDNSATRLAYRDVEAAPLSMPFHSTADSPERHDNHGA